jgi:hypothetical protein
VSGDSYDALEERYESRGALTAPPSTRSSEEIDMHESRTRTLPYRDAVTHQPYRSGAHDGMRRRCALLALIGVVAGLTACGKAEAAADSAPESTREVDALRAGRPDETGTAISDEERASGTVTVTGTQPAADGTVQVMRRAALQMPASLAAWSIDGLAGPVEHTFLIVFDSSGAVKLVTHKWRNADNSVMAQTDCGGRTKCDTTRISANPKTGSVSFRDLTLTGVDGNTAAVARSTLTGSVQ